MSVCHFISHAVYHTITYISLKSSVFIRPHEHTKTAVSKISTLGSVLESSVFGDHNRRIRVDGKAIRREKFAFSNKNGYVWTGPYILLSAALGGPQRVGGGAYLLNLRQFSYVLLTEPHGEFASKCFLTYKLIRSRSSMFFFTKYLERVWTQGKTILDGIYFGEIVQIEKIRR